MFHTRSKIKENAIQSSNTLKKILNLAMYVRGANGKTILAIVVYVGSMRASAFGVDGLKSIGPLNEERMELRNEAQEEDISVYNFGRLNLII